MELYVVAKTCVNTDPVRIATVCLVSVMETTVHFWVADFNESTRAEVNV